MDKSERGAQILIVEDEAIVSLDIRKTLIGAGYRVAHVAASAEDALRSMESAMPDLVLMDIHIQGKLDGVETAAIIRQRYQVPVIFVTAHADAETLERAKASQPFGYIVKPISKQSLTSSVEMALHKNEVEKRLQEHRAWMSTVLGGLPDAVIVTAIDGKVEFANPAAERLIERKQASLVLRDVTTNLRLSCPGITELTAVSLQEAIENGRFDLPRDTLLALPTGDRIPVEGQVAISSVGNRMAGAIFTLRDATKREQEELQLRQEEKMLALGEFATDLSESFYGLFDQIAQANAQLRQFVEGAARDGRDTRLLQDAESVQRASKMGKLMSGQLAKLGDPQSLHSKSMNINTVIAETLPVFQKLRGPLLNLQTELCTEPAAVFCTANHLEQMLVNVLISCREFLSGATGTLQIRTQILNGHREHVQLKFELASSASLPQTTNPDVAVASAIITAAGGSLRFDRQNDDKVTIEILLPRQRASIRAEQKLQESNGMVLVVGSTQQLARSIEQQLETHDYLTIDCSNVSEALFVARFYDGDIAAVIADAEGVSVHNRQRVKKVFSNRNRNTKFLCLATETEPAESGWFPVSKESQLHDISNALDALSASAAHS